MDDSQDEGDADQELSPDDGEVAFTDICSHLAEIVDDWLRHQRYGVGPWDSRLISEWLDSSESLGPLKSLGEMTPAEASKALEVVATAYAVENEFTYWLMRETAEFGILRRLAVIHQQAAGLARTWLDHETFDDPDTACRILLARVADAVTAGDRLDHGPILLGGVFVSLFIGLACGLATAAEAQKLVPEFDASAMLAPFLTTTSTQRDAQAGFRALLESDVEGLRAPDSGADDSGGLENDQPVDEWETIDAYRTLLEKLEDLRNTPIDVKFSFNLDSGRLFDDSEDIGLDDVWGEDDP